MHRSEERTLTYKITLGCKDVRDTPNATSHAAERAFPHTPCTQRDTSVHICLRTTCGVGDVASGSHRADSRWRRKLLRCSSGRVPSCYFSDTYCSDTPFVVSASLRRLLLRKVECTFSMTTTNLLQPSSPMSFLSTHAFSPRTSARTKPKNLPTPNDAAGQLIKSC